MTEHHDKNVALIFTFLLTTAPVYTKDETGARCLDEEVLAAGKKELLFVVERGDVAKYLCYENDPVNDRGVVCFQDKLDWTWDCGGYIALSVNLVGANGSAPTSIEQSRQMLKDHGMTSSAFLGQHSYIYTPRKAETMDVDGDDEELKPPTYLPDKTSGTWRFFDHESNCVEVTVHFEATPELAPTKLLIQSVQVAVTSEGIRRIRQILFSE